MTRKGLIGEKNGKEEERREERETRKEQNPLERIVDGLCRKSGEKKKEKLSRGTQRVTERGEKTLQKDTHQVFSHVSPLFTLLFAHFGRS